MNTNKLAKLRQKEAAKQYRFNETPFIEVDLSIQSNVPKNMTRCFRNNRYIVMIYDNKPMTKGISATLAMIQKHDALPIPNHWKELQRIKNEIFGKEVTAIEYYPKESELIDVANIYWLFMFEENVIPIMLHK